MTFRNSEPLEYRNKTTLSVHMSFNTTNLSFIQYSPFCLNGLLRKFFFDIPLNCYKLHDTFLQAVFRRTFSTKVLRYSLKFLKKTT